MRQVSTPTFFACIGLAMATTIGLTLFGALQVADIIKPPKRPSAETGYALIKYYPYSAYAPGATVLDVVAEYETCIDRVVQSDEYLICAPFEGFD